MNQDFEVRGGQGVRDIREGTVGLGGPGGQDSIIKIYLRGEKKGY